MTDIFRPIARRLRHFLRRMRQSPLTNLDAAWRRLP